MPITVAAPPQRVPIFSGFDYVTVDEARHRAYAAHTRSHRLLIVDTRSGKVLAQVDVGPMHGVAVDPSTGVVFTGNGTDRHFSKVDPTTAKCSAASTFPATSMRSCTIPRAAAFTPTRMAADPSTSSTPRR